MEVQVKKNIIVAGSSGKPMLVDCFHQSGKAELPVVIYAHGFNGFKDWGNFDLIAQQFASAGFCFIKFNFSHNGTTVDHPDEFKDLEAFGNNNYTKQLFDLQSIVDWVVDEANSLLVDFIDSNRIHLIGHSMGGGIVLLKAAEDRRISKVVTWAGIAECKTPWGKWPNDKLQAWETSGVEFYRNGRTGQDMPLYYQLYKDYEENQERLDITNAAKKLRIPLLICHGLQDTAVPVEAAHQLHTANPVAELFLVDGDHVFDRKHPWLENDLPNSMQLVVNKTISFLQFYSYN